MIKLPLTLAVLRKRVKLSQIDLGGKIDRPQAEISLIETGSQKLQEDLSEVILKVLHENDHEGIIPVYVKAKDLQRSWEDVILETR